MCSPSQHPQLWFLAVPSKVAVESRIFVLVAVPREVSVPQWLVRGLFEEKIRPNEDLEAFGGKEHIRDFSSKC